jgi:UDP-N-acetylmuramyl tripeptide synthase
MRIRVFISLLVCRFSGFLLRLAGRGGTNLPGRIALKLCPRVLEAMSVGVSVVIVTGTNGKTTTSRMLEECFKRAGLSCFANRSGANLLSGIVAEFARNCSLSGRCKKPYAIIECDEAAFRQVSRQLSAKCILVTNVFRDQLDRFGEITHTLESIREAVENSPQAVVCLNADCSLTASLAENLPNWIVWYGLDEPVYGERAEELSDAVYCLRCKSPYSYDYRTYGHLGAWKCPGCGWERPSPDVSVMHIAGMNEDGSEIDIKYSDNVYHASVALPARRL